MKLSLQTFYNKYVQHKPSSQFEAITNFASKHVYARTAVFLALYSGGKQSTFYQAELSKLLGEAAVKKRVIPIMASATGK